MSWDNINGDAPLSAGVDAVWPPPVIGQTQPMLFHPGTFLYERVDGSVADFRSGSIGADASGSVIDGIVIPRAEIYQTIMIATLFLYGLWTIAWLIMQLLCQRRATATIPWDKVDSITTMPRSRKLCVVYRAPNYKKIEKTFSITMQFKKGIYESITDALDEYAPGLAQPGVIKGANSPVIIVWGVSFFAMVLFWLVTIALASMGYWS